jgi:hypothetical protein
VMVIIGFRRLLSKVSPTLGLILEIEPRVCSMDMYSDASVSAKAKVSMICVPWVLETLIDLFFEIFTATALRAGMMPVIVK